VAHLLTKLDARDRIQLVILAYQSGLAVLARGASPENSRRRMSWPVRQS